MIQDTPYYDKVALFLSKMKEGDTFSINDKVRAENRGKFIECFRWFAAVTGSGPWWWEWDDESNIIKKHAHAWYMWIKKGL